MDGRDRPEHSGDTRVHRALSSPVRSRLLATLRASEDPLGVAALTEILGLHANTVRAHLAILEEADLVASEAEPRDRPGRPRRVYRPTEEAETAGEDGGYRLLAQILASHVKATTPDPSTTAEAAGHAWGRYLVDRPPPFRALPPGAAVDRLVELMAGIGFAPALEGDDPSETSVLLRRCPFLDVAREHPDVVCSVHLGLMRGALEELGTDVRARELLPFVAPGLCVGHLDVPS